MSPHLKVELSLLWLEFELSSTVISGVLYMKLHKNEYPKVLDSVYKLLERPSGYSKKNTKILKEIVKCLSQEKKLKQSQPVNMAATV